MFTRNKIGFLVVMSFIALAEVKGSSKYYDGEIRPYEFGYKIEGNQHRHEKKDANGLINGEFGFITGDGAYHSSVYATDENGNFKLLSLRSTFRIVKATATTTTAPPTTLASVAISRESKSLENRLISVKSCSNCKVIENEILVVTLTAPNPITVEGKAVSSSFPTSTVAVESKEQKHENSTLKLDKLTKSNQFDNGNVLSNSQPNSIGQIAKFNVGSPLNIALGISTAGIKSLEEIERKHKQTEQNNNASNSRISSEKLTTSKISSGVKSNHMLAITQTNSETEISNTIDNQIPIEETHQRTGKTLQPSTSSQLSSKKAINEFIGDVIYRFNYTAGHHGHNEEGDSFGNKVGGYFIVGRDNIKRGVIYVANGNGFIPVVKYEKVSSSEAPHEDTEKNAGLRGYEFEWFHKGKSI